MDKTNIQSNLNNSNTDGLFTMANLNSFFESVPNSSNISRKQIFREILLFYQEIVCCVYSLELSHLGNSEYTQHTIIMFVCVEVLRPSQQPMGSCRAWSVYLTTRLLGRLSPLSS